MMKITDGIRRKLHHQCRKLKPSFTSLTLKIFIPLIFVAVIGLVFLGRGIVSTRELAYKYIEETAGLYVMLLGRDIQQISEELVLNKEIMMEAKRFPAHIAPQHTEYYALFASIEKQNTQLQSRYAEIDNVYLFQRASGLLLLEEGVYFPESRKDAYISALISFLEEKSQENNTKVHWEFMETEENTYLVSWYGTGGVLRGGIINMTTVFSKLEEMSLNYRAIPYMKLSEGRYLRSTGVTMPELMELTERASQNAYDWRRGNIRKCSYSLANIGVIQLLVIPSGGALESAIQLQILFFVILAAMAVVGVLTVYLYYRRILRPMKRFVEEFRDAEKEQSIHENGQNNILELEMASKEFRNLLRKIQALKIDLYEKELEKQRIELDYHEEHIKPHFFLNCLNIIHSIADDQNEPQIVSITEILSDYFRYIFSGSSELRALDDELRHVENYIRIQKMRYGEDAFAFELMQDKEAGNPQIPSLMLQTLVENAVLHGVTLDRAVVISLYITVEEYEGKHYLYLSFTDTGNGFSGSVLRHLENSEPIIYENRRHIGLLNVKKRLELIYGGEASFHCSNMAENYGAVIEIRIPV